MSCHGRATNPAARRCLMPALATGIPRTLGTCGLRTPRPARRCTRCCSRPTRQADANSSIWPATGIPTRPKVDSPQGEAESHGVTRARARPVKAAEEASPACHRSNPFPSPPTEREQQEATRIPNPGHGRPIRSPLALRMPQQRLLLARRNGHPPEGRLPLARPFAAIRRFR